MIRITGTLREDLCTFMIISDSILLRMRNVSDKFCREWKHKFYVQYFFSPKIFPLWENVQKYSSTEQATDG